MIFDPNSIYYAYLLFDEAGTPKWAGKGKKERWFDHEKYHDPVNAHKQHFINKTLRILGRIPKIKFCGLNEEEAYELEIWLIATIGRYPHGPLCNKTPGGPGFDPEKAKLARQRAKATLHREKDADGKSINAKLRGKAGYKGRMAKNPESQRKAQVKGGLAGSKVLHSARLPDGRSAHGVWFSKSVHEAKDENGKSITARKAGLASAAVGSFLISNKTLHAKKNADGKSVHMIKMTKALHAEKTPEGKSVHTMKLYAEKRPDGKSVVAVRNGMKRWHPELFDEDGNFTDPRETTDEQS